MGEKFDGWKLWTWPCGVIISTMSAERDENARVEHGFFYTTEEMKYLCEVELLVYPANPVHRETLLLLKSYLDTLPNDSLISYVVDPKTQTPHFSIAYIGTVDS
jgi:hypothetical protein